MISASALYSTAGGVYLATFLALLGWRRRLPDAVHRYANVVLVVVGLSAVGNLSRGLGLATVQVGQGELAAVLFLTDLGVYGLLWAVTAMLGNATRRQLALIAAIPVGQRISFEVAALSGGLPALLGLVGVVGGHFVVAYLLLGPVWTRARALPEAQRVLHWKARNLLLFLVGVIIAFAVTTVVADIAAFVGAFVTIYVGVLIRVGYAAFLFWNVADLAGDDVESTGGESAPEVPADTRPGGVI